MEGSRRGKKIKEKGLPTPDPHVDGGNGKKAIVYNTKKRKKRWHGKKTKKKEKRENKGKRLKKYNSKRKEFSILSHSIKACPRIFSIYVRV